MSDALRPNSIAFLPFSPDELSRLRRLARRCERFDELAAHVQRLQILRTLRSGELDAEAALGAARAEAEALSRLARSRALDQASLRIKAELFTTADPGPDNNLAHILSAALEADRGWLASLRAPDAPPRPTFAHRPDRAP